MITGEGHQKNLAGSLIQNIALLRLIITEIPLGRQHPRI